MKIKSYNVAEKKAARSIHNSTQKPQMRSKKLFRKTGQLGQLHLIDIVPGSDSQQQLQSIMQTLLESTWRCKNLQQGDHHHCLPGQKSYRGKEKGFFLCSSGKRSHEHHPWRGLQGRASQACQKGNLIHFSRQFWIWHVFIWKFLPRKSREQRLTKRITKLVEKATSEHCNTRCCLSFIGS